ncbi:MepB family protein [Streptomyces mobaraensis]|uniref:MepB domain containing protein n=1 Tax=Streptomyces mobaraensis TaxID=35621 RepID=A0A5N5W218_STRMB|nr:MepB family protein [Streptomyces mobaraensis]KAB7836045.1 MepB domain containing protein [Streptomyces mobaraensis]
MVANQAWAGLHGDLSATKALVYEPGGFVCSVPVPEPESAEYAACAFTLDGRSVRFRVGKATPTKAGRFVTVWQRSEEGPIRPFDADDGVDLFVVSSRDDDGGFGQFVFPVDVLVERGVVSRGGSGGKRGFRVYPPWVTTTSRQAGGTQAWQADFFLDLGRNEAPDLGRARALYHS